MSKITKTLLLTAVMAVMSLFSHAYDFKVDGLGYNILSPIDKTCEVAYCSTSVNPAPEYMNIPATVTYNGITYSVTTIGTRAFKGCI